MGLTIQQVVEYIVDLLETNISEPLLDRTTEGKKWIYDDAPRYDMSSYPRIGIYGEPSTFEEYAVGSLAQLENQNIVIDILTKSGDKIAFSTAQMNGYSGVTIEGNKYLRGEEIVDNLTKQCLNLIRSNHTAHLNEGIISIRPTTYNIQKLDNNMVVGRITIQARNKRE